MAIEIKASSLDKNFRRTIPKPIDASSVWATYAQAAEYAANNGTDDYCPLRWSVGSDAGRLSRC